MENESDTKPAATYKEASISHCLKTTMSIWRGEFRTQLADG